MASDGDVELEGQQSEVLSATQQKDIIAGASTLDGIKRFTQAVLSGQLTDYFPFRVNNHEDFTNSFEPSLYGSGALSYYVVDRAAQRAGIHRTFSVEVSTNPDLPEQIKLHVANGPTPGPPGIQTDLGIQMGGNWEYVEGIESSDLKFRGGEVFIQTTAEPDTSKVPTFDAVIVVGEEGVIRDIVTPEQRNYDKNYAATLEEVGRRIESDRFPLGAIATSDQLKASFQEEGVVTGLRGKNSNTKLSSQVASILGIEVKGLSGMRVDLRSSMESALNRDPVKKPPVVGQGAVSVPPIIVK